VHVPGTRMCIGWVPEVPHEIFFLADFNAKVGREGIFKLTAGNESFHKTNNDNGITVVTMPWT